MNNLKEINEQVEKVVNLISIGDRLEVDYRLNCYNPIDVAEYMIDDVFYAYAHAIRAFRNMINLRDTTEDNNEWYVINAIIGRFSSDIKHYQKVIKYALPTYYNSIIDFAKLF